MLNKIIQISKYLLSDLFFNVIYGFVLYYVCTWLAGYSLLYAYLGNLVLIILVLIVDELTLKYLKSEKFVMQMKKKKDSEESYRSIQHGLANSVSFKTDLYVFYIFVLIVSQIIVFNPALVG